MMKKLTRSVALILVLVLVLVPDVSAAEDDSSFIDAMALGSIQGSGLYTTTVAKNGSFVFKFVTPMQVSYVDFTLRIAGTAPTDISVNGISSTIEFIKVTTDVYRVYGRLSSSGVISQLTFKFTSTTSNQISIVHASIAVSRYDNFETSGILTWVNGSTRTQIASWAAGGSGSDTLSGTSGSTANWIRDYEVKLTDWEGADIIELLIKMENLSVGSIAGYMNGSQLPIDVDPLYVFDEGGSSNSTSEDGNILGEENEEGFLYDDGEYNGLTYTEGDYWSTGSIKDYGFRGTRVYRVRLDLRSVNRYEQKDYDPVVRFCVIGPASVQCKFTVGSSRCFVDMDGIEGLALVGLWIQDLGVIFQSYTESLGNVIGQGFDAIGQKIDQLLGTGDEGDELSSESEQLQEDIGQIDEFEQTQMYVMDTGMIEIQDAVSVASFTGALSFVQTYLNLTFMGFGDVMVIFTLPLFLGLFFYICSRIPGATRWKSPPPKGGKK